MFLVFENKMENIDNVFTTAAIEFKVLTTNGIGATIPPVILPPYEHSEHVNYMSSIIK